MDIDLAKRAERAVELAHTDPAGAVRLATPVRAAARASGDAEAVVVAERALGLAAVERGEIGRAVQLLRGAAARAARAGLARREAEARMSLSLALFWRGSAARALAEADRAAPGLSGAAAARLAMQRALILQRLGRPDEALQGYRSALPAFRRAGDDVAEARLLNNRGILHAYRGAFAAAESDLSGAERLHLEGGRELAAAQVRHNLGWVAARRGDLPAALRSYERADVVYARLGAERATLALDRAEVLLAARLADEAWEAASAAVEELGRGAARSDLAEARVIAAQAALLRGDHEAARLLADRARSDLVRQGRPAWAALARHASVLARWRAGERTAAVLTAARRAAGELQAAGWRVAALDARVVAARVALDRGDPAAATAELTAARRARARGPVEVRTRAWHAEALLRASRGDRGGAARAVSAGLRALERHRAVLGASELRTQASGHAEDLALLGLRLALESGRPAAVLSAVEAARARALGSLAVRPATDPEMAALLAELRATAAAAAEALGEGRLPPGGLASRRVRLETAVRERARQAAGDGGAPDGAPPVAALAAALGDRALIELFAAEGGLRAITLVDGRLALHALGPVASVGPEVEALRFAVRRLATRHGGAAARAAVEAAARAAAGRLEGQVLGPLLPLVADRGLVVVPSGALHALPWAALPALSTRAMTVAPSAAAWVRAERRATAGWGGEHAVALVAGPGLPQAGREVVAIARRYPGAARLTGPDATAAAVLAALGRADRAHVAAHGRFRADNALFSALVVADGPVTVYDLEGLPRPPEQIVLSSCDVGLADVRVGDEVLGLAAALLGMGSTALVASVVPVPDEDVQPFMSALHAELGRGARPAEALAAARAGPGEVGGAGLAARWGFVCFGAG